MQDDLIKSASVWLACDLAALCVAVGQCIELGLPLEIRECPPDEPTRLEEMARLLRVGADLMGDVSDARRFVVDAIRERLSRELGNAPAAWGPLVLPNVSGKSG
jgi:hypothetical protein